eukprot:9120148-Alexandrium_andersonii.AAC.1
MCTTSSWCMTSSSVRASVDTGPVEGVPATMRRPRMYVDCNFACSRSVSGPHVCVLYTSLDTHRETCSMVRAD